MNNDIEKIILDEKEIRRLVKKLGKKMTEDYKDKNPIVVCVLKGASVFFTDIIRAMDCPLEIDFVSASSYGNSTTSEGSVAIKKDITKNVSGRHVIFVEDIIDTGRTLKTLKDMMEHRGASSVKLCAFLDKPSRRVVDIDADYVCTDIDDMFVVGYGLDYAEKYRNLPYIGVLKEELYK